MSPPSIRRSVLSVAIVLTLCTVGTAQQGPAAPPPRAKPPVWKELPPGIFFENAFRDGLRGPRPRADANAGQIPPRSTVPSATAATESPSAGWARLVSATTLEDEIKAIKLRCDEALKSEGHFKGQGYRDLRPHLGCAATVFGIIEQYDGTVRWQKDAATASQSFGRVALNMKVGSTPVYREAVQRQQDLSDLIAGGRIASVARNEPLSWPDVADRQLLMQRLELAVQQQLAAGVGSARDLTQQAARLIHEAELTAALAHVLRQAGMGEADDPEYVKFCEDLEQAARQFAEQAQRGDYNGARQAHGVMKNSCVNCHEQYRA